MREGIKIIIVNLVTQLNALLRQGSEDKRPFVARLTVDGEALGRNGEVLARKRAMMQEVVPGTEPAENLGLDEEDIFKLFDIRVRPRRTIAAA